MIKLTKERKLYLLFFLSGFVNLFLQVIWQRELTLIFGGTIYSTTIILASWMAGIAIGSYLVGILRKRFSNLYTVFCYFQLAVLFFALIFPIVLSALNLIDKGLFTITQNSLSLSLFTRGIFIFFSLLIPTTLIGAIFPLVAEVAGEKKISYIYSINALGSALGALFTGFVLIPYFGVIYSMIIVLVLFITIFVFGIAFSIEYKQTQNLNGTSSLPNKSQKNTNAFVQPITKTFNGILKKIAIIIIPLLFLISGFTALSYEVLYNKILIYFTGNSSYCFTIIVATFILGISLGSFFFYLLKKILSSFTVKLIVFALLELAIGIWHIFLPLYSDSINLLSVTIKSLLGSMPVVSVFFTRIFASVLIIFPPIVIFGFLFPLVIDIFLQLSPKETTKRVGLLYFFNTIGSVIGALITGTLLIKLLHISLSMRLIAKINIIIALIILIFSLIIINKKKIIFVFSFITIIIIFTLGLFFSSKISAEFSVGKKAALTTKYDKLLYYDEGVFGTVSVSQKWDGTLNLKINGVGEVPTDYNSIRTFRLLGYLPFMIRKNSKSLLAIAFGGGITFGSICQVSSLEYKKDIEICKGVIEAANKFYTKWNHNVVKTNRDDIIIEDGRRFIKNINKEFNIIVSDSTHPGSFDSWVLYTKEFYSQCKNKLTTGGVMVQWLPIHDLSIYDYKTILKTFARVFKETTLFFCEEYTIIAGSDDKIVLDKSALEKLLASDTIQQDLSQANLDTFKSIVNTKVFDTKLFKDFCKKGDIATDNLSALQFAETRRFGKDTRVTITDALYDFLRENKVNIYMQVTLKTHNFIYQKKYVQAIFYLDKMMPLLKKKGQFDKGLLSLFNRLKKLISIEFSKPTTINFYLNNFSMENLSKLQKLNNIVLDDHNILLLIAKYYYHSGKNEETLKIFYKMKKLYHDPDTYRNLIIHLYRLNRNSEATKYLQEAKEKFGKKWGDKIFNKKTK